MFKGIKKDGLLAEIAGIQAHQFIEPPKHPGTFEVLGEFMNDFEKQAYTVMSRIKKQIDEMQEAVLLKETPANKKRILNSEIRVLKMKFYYVKDLMYFSINDRLSFWDRNLGVSQGFKIVIPEAEEVLQLSEIPFELPPELREKIKAILEKAADSKGGCKTSCFTSPGSSATH